MRFDTAFIKKAIQAILLIALVGYLLVTKQADIQKAVAVVTTNSIPFFIGSLIFCAAAAFLTAVRQKELLRPLAPGISLRRLCTVTYAGIFANNFLPANLGLDASRFMGFYGHESLRPSKLTSWIVVDRVVALAGLISLSLFAVLLTVALQQGGAQSGAVVKYFLFVVALCVLGLIAGFTVIFSDTLLNLIKRLTSRWNIADSIDRVAQGFRGYCTNPRTLVRPLATASLAYLANILGICVLAWLLGGLPAAQMALIGCPIVLLASAVPVTPGNLGWTEGVAGMVWHMADAGDGVALFLLWRFVVLFFSLGGSLAWLHIRKEYAPR